MTTGHENSTATISDVRSSEKNFTVEGMPEDEIQVGDVFRIGGARVEVTQPRVPCYRLGIKMDNVQFPKNVSSELPRGILFEGARRR